MPGGPGRAFSWPALAIRAAAIAVCAVALQQCSKPSGGPTSPTGPTTQNPPGPPTVPTPTPDPPGPQVFVGAGDIAICGPNGNAEATAKLVEGIGGQVFTLGDNAYPNGSAENFRDCYEPTWGRFKGRTRPAPGNHEYQTPGASTYYQYFGGLAGPAGLGYYSYPLGAWHIISLNSEPSVAIGGAMEAWLRSDLAANTAKCTLAYWHHPLFTSGQNGENGYMRPTYRILYEANADVVLSGHDHLYERFAPQDPDGRFDLSRGIRQFVVGTGGVPFYQFMATRPNSEARMTGPGTTGVIRFTLLADSYQWEFITTGQGTRDNGSGTCH